MTWPGACAGEEVRSGEHHPGGSRPVGTVWCGSVGAVLGKQGLPGSKDKAQGCISALMPPWWCL